MDFAVDDKGQKLDGGLPRHVGLDAHISNEKHTYYDFTKDLSAITAMEIPEQGTLAEKAAMAAHSTRLHPSFLPDGTPAHFRMNGMRAQRGAPFADPGADEKGNPITRVRRDKGANIQVDGIFNRKGWHFPQQRMIALWGDVADTLDGKRPPQPLFFRANSGEVVEYWHANLVPAYYELDDFQVRTPTDILGQHIHLVKFDVLASDGAANGFNYEDGTFAPDEVRDRIFAIDAAGGLKPRPMDGDCRARSIEPDRGLVDAGDPLAQAAIDDEHRPRHVTVGVEVAHRRGHALAVIVDGFVGAVDHQHRGLARHVDDGLRDWRAPRRELAAGEIRDGHGLVGGAHLIEREHHHLYAPAVADVR